MRTLSKYTLTITALAALSVLRAYASEPEHSPSPTPTPHVEPSSTPRVEPSPTPRSEPSSTPRHEPSSTPRPEPSSTPHDEPSASPSASPGDDDGGGHHGEVSLRGFFEGVTPSGALAVFYISDNSHVQIHVIDTNAQAVGFAEGPLTHGAFALALTTGESITGSATQDTLTVSINGQQFQAGRVPVFGPEESVAGRYFGVAHSASGAESQVMFLIDTNNDIVMIQRSGTTLSGGYGTVTAPISPATQYTFTLDHFVGSTAPITGSFTVKDGTFVGSFSTSAGTFTVNTFNNSLANRLANISTRGLVAPGEGQLIGGFIITGGPKMVLIRALGPSLTAHGVTNPLSNPQLQLFAGSTLLASNDDWKTDAKAAQLVASQLAPTDDLEAALLVRLEPGAYTTVVSGTGDTTGVALVEVYEAGFE